MRIAVGVALAVAALVGACSSGTSVPGAIGGVVAGSGGSAGGGGGTSGVAALAGSAGAAGNAGSAEAGSAASAGAGAGTGAAAGRGGAGAGSGASGTGGRGGAGAAGSAGRPDDGEVPYPPIQGGCNGYATRYWDCCKPHCGWSANVPSGVSPLRTCSAADASLGNIDAQSSCNGGSAFMCHAMVPFAVNNRFAYGYAAVAGRGDICGRCFQLQFTGSSRSGNDPGSSALSGKTMVVQATNVGGDVGSGQFDLLTPGGGVGAFNACSSQWGVPAAQLGAQYGGFLTRCKQQVGATDHAAIKRCVSESCTSVFESRGLSELAAGCRWFVEWFEAADNPSLVYKEIPCPEPLKTGGLNRSSSGNSCL